MTQTLCAQRRWVFDLGRHDIVIDGNVRVSWLTAIANVNAPTTAELNAGVALEALITPDGLKIAVSTAGVDNTALNTTQNTQLSGRRSDQITLTFKQQGYGAAPWTTFAGVPAGFLVIRRGLAAATAWTSAQKVIVYTLQAGYRQPSAPVPNDMDKFDVDFFVSGAVSDTAAVA